MLPNVAIKLFASVLLIDLISIHLEKLSTKIKYVFPFKWKKTKCILSNGNLPHPQPMQLDICVVLT